MKTDVFAEEIKETRLAYGLSQKSFAILLGIGEASMVRYEQGSVPSKANSKLIRAAKNPQFMLECLEEEGNLIPESQRERAERYIYECISLESEAGCSLADQGNFTARMNERYMMTLRQEVLGEQAAAILAKLASLKISGRLSECEVGASAMRAQIAGIKPTIVAESNMSEEKLLILEGYMGCAQEFADRVEAKVSIA